MYSVWYRDGDEEVVFVRDIPTRTLADKIANNLADQFGAASVWVEQD